MSTSSEDAKLSVAMPTHSVSEPTPPHNSHHSNGTSPGSVASGNGAPQVPCEKQSARVDKQGISQAQKKRPSLVSMNSAVELASSLQKKSTDVFQTVSNVFSLSPTIQEDSVKGAYVDDPVVNTIRQLWKEYRRDRDMCCGFAPRFRSAFKAMWMIASVLIVWIGFIGLEHCKGQPLTPAYVSVQGFILLIYLGLVEVSGAVAIGKGRRWGVLVLLLSQPLVILTLVFGYVALLPMGVPISDQVYMMAFADNSSTNSSVLAQGSMFAPTNWTANVSGSACDENYANFAKALFALGHFMVGFVLLYSLVACVCLVRAQEHRRRVEFDVITESPVKSAQAGGNLGESTTEL